MSNFLESAAEQVSVSLCSLLTSSCRAIRRPTPRLTISGAFVSKKQLLIGVVVAAFSASAQAGVISYDFETLPDSAECSKPTSSHVGSDGALPDNAFENGCDPNWLASQSAAALDGPGSFVDVEDGISMDIYHLGGAHLNLAYDNSWWADGVFQCGNTVFCGGVVASFSKALSAAIVDFAGVGSADAIPFDEGSTFSYVLSAYSGEHGSGDLLGSASILNLPTALVDLQIALGISGIGDFRSLVISGAGLADGLPNNLARIDAISVQTVPEPSTLALLGASLLGLFFQRRRRTPC